MFKEIFENLRKTAPLVHNITNYVTVNDVANVLLASGAKPIMADELEDAVEITTICNGLNINIGTLNTRTIKSMFETAKKAKELTHLTVLDPVGAGASKLRTETALKLSNEVKFDVIKGNISEIKTLINGEGTTKGVEADIADVVNEENLDQIVNIMKDFSKKIGSIIVVSGKIDIVTDGIETFIIKNGRAEMSQITGSGCQLSALICAFISANKNNILHATAAAVCTMGLAGELAWENMQEFDGNSTYRNRIIDSIYNMTGDDLEKGAKYEIR